MYFSKVELNKTSPELYSVLSKIRQNDGYYLHRLIWTLFSDDRQPSKSRDFLYRQETQGHWSTFYIISDSLPIDKYGIWVIQSKLYVPQICEGEHFYFSLRANPRLIKKQADGKKCYHDAVMDLKKRLNAKVTTSEIIQEAGMNWLTKCSASRGFKPVDVMADSYQQHKLIKNDHLIRFSTLEYKGIIEVTNSQLFLESLFKGVGAAKGFGCGLVLIKRK